MIPNIRNGISFRSAWLYYLHDKREPGETLRLTTSRVAWTHTLNCAFDDPAMALQEMRDTAASHGLLKARAGLAASGRPVQALLKTVSLAWAPDERPDKQIMIAAAESYLRFMGWSEGHQCVLVAHSDAPHRHVHLLIGRVHPVTGRVLDDWRDRPRSQRWAHEYDKGQGKIRCKLRAARYDHGAAIPASGVPHPVMQSWKRQAGPLNAQLDAQREIDALEWGVLKQLQRDERDAFRMESRGLAGEARQVAYREVRDTFRAEWQDYFEARAGGLAGPALKALRADILGRQRDATTAAQLAAATALYDARGEAYGEMLKRHREDRSELRTDQAAGIRRYDILAKAEPKHRGGEAAPVAGSVAELVPTMLAGRIRQERQDARWRPMPIRAMGRAVMTGVKPDALIFDNAPVLRPMPLLTDSDQVSTAPVPSPLSFRQLLVQEGLSVLNIDVKGADPLAGHAPLPRAGPKEPRPAAPSRGDAGERALIEQEYAAKMAAARLCTPRVALDAVLQGLRQERQSRLAALHARAAARQSVRQAEQLAHRYREAAEIIAMGVPQPKRPPSMEQRCERVLASILKRTAN